MVVMGVPERLIEQQAVDELAEGVARNLLEVARARLSMLHVQRLAKRDPDERQRPDSYLASPPR